MNGNKFVSGVFSAITAGVFNAALLTLPFVAALFMQSRYHTQIEEAWSADSRLYMHKLIQRRIGTLNTEPATEDYLNQKIADYIARDEAALVDGLLLAKYFHSFGNQANSSNPVAFRTPGLSSFSSKQEKRLAINAASRELPTELRRSFVTLPRLESTVPNSALTLETDVVVQGAGRIDFGPRLIQAENELLIRINRWLRGETLSHDALHIPALELIIWTDSELEAERKEQLLGGLTALRQSYRLDNIHPEQKQLYDRSLEQLFNMTALMPALETLVQNTQSARFRNGQLVGAFRNVIHKEAFQLLQSELAALSKLKAITSQDGVLAFLQHSPRAYSEPRVELLILAGGEMGLFSLEAFGENALNDVLALPKWDANVERHIISLLWVLLALFIAFFTQMHICLSNLQMKRAAKRD